MFGITSPLEAQTQLPAPAPNKSSLVDQRPPDQPPLATPASGDIADPFQIEYLTRGPLHEAFAEPYEPEPVLNPLVTVEPPAPIDEVPPEFRPEGDLVTWIPGYWAWDDERNDYLWISGVWRQLPPRHRWVPGYWNQSGDGFRWINGFWSNTEVAEVQYLPEPPESLNEGPSAPAPSEQHFYVPGSWVYESNDYRWQPGFWSRSHDNWVWVPSQSIWTPRGCILRPGYWDYDVAYRGVVFTPVRFRQPIYRSPNYTYRPSYTIDTGLNLFVHLFVRPSSRQYYFGDYYGTQYANNYYPWVTRYEQPGYYDPFYAHYRNQTRDDSNVINWVNTQYRYFKNEKRHRPPRTIEAQRQFIRANRNANLSPTIVRLATFGDSLENIVAQKNQPFSFQSLTRNDVRRFVDSGTPMRELSRSRQDNERVDVSLGADLSSPAADPNVRDAIVDGVRDGESDRRRGNRGVLRLPAVDQSTDASTETIDAIEQARHGRDPKGTQLDSSQTRDRIVDGVTDQRPNVERSDLRRDAAESDLPNERNAVNEAMRNNLRPGNVSPDAVRSDAVVSPLDRASRGRENRQPPAEIQDRIDERLRQADRFRGQTSNEPMRPDQPSDWPRRQPRITAEPVPGVPNVVEGGRSFRPRPIDPGRAMPSPAGTRSDAPGRVKHGKANPSPSPEANQPPRSERPSTVPSPQPTRPTASRSAGQENQQRSPKPDAVPGNSGGGNKSKKPPKNDKKKG